MADDYTFPVDATAVMLFASAIGETNPIYYDEQKAKQTPLGGVIAPPTFVIASALWSATYPLRGVRQIPAPPERAEAPKPRKKPAAGASSSGGGGLARGLHGEQRFEYHKPVRPGMKLTVSSRPGKSWEKQGRRGGTMRFSENISEFRDENGDLVVTATSVGIVTSQAVETS